MHLEDDTPNLSVIRQTINAFLREHNNYCGDSSKVLPDYGHVCDTVIPYNTDIIMNNSHESRYFFLYSLHNSGTKYRIYSIRTETSTNITIHKIS